MRAVLTIELLLLGLGVAPYGDTLQGQGAAVASAPQQGQGGRGRGDARGRTRKVVLAWADTRNGISQHDSTSHALSVIEQMGYDTGTADDHQARDGGRDKFRVLLRLDVSSMPPHPQLRNQDYPIAWAKMYGKGRVFDSSLGHATEMWDHRDVRQMYFEALKWALGLTEGDAGPRPAPTRTRPLVQCRIAGTPLGPSIDRVSGCQVPAHAAA